jgi:hypothetical protein
VSEQDPRNPDDLDVETPADDAAEQREPVGADDLEDVDDGDLPVEVDPGDLQEQQREAVPSGQDEDDYR